jgi:hypothetical protein
MHGPGWPSYYNIKSYINFEFRLHDNRASPLCRCINRFKANRAGNRTPTYAFILKM